MYTFDRLPPPDGRATSRRPPQFHKHHSRFPRTLCNKARQVSHWFTAAVSYVADNHRFVRDAAVLLRPLVVEDLAFSASCRLPAPLRPLFCTTQHHAITILAHFFNARYTVPAGHNGLVVRALELKHKTTHTHTHLAALFPVVVASAGPYASLHLAPDR